MATLKENNSNPLVSLYKKVLLAQSQMPKIEKDSINPHFKARFASLPKILEVALPVLQNNGLLFTTRSIRENNERMLNIRIVDVDTGEYLESNIDMMNVTDMQKIGQAFTYASRYGLLSLLGLSADIDTDAEGVVEHEMKTKNNNKIKKESFDEETIKTHVNSFCKTITELNDFYKTTVRENQLTEDQINALAKICKDRKEVLQIAIQKDDIKQ